MKNRDKLAFPIEINGFGQYAPEVHVGLTKREVFAMNAPDVPEWFKKDWEKANNKNSEFFVLVNAYCEFSNIDYQDREITVKGQMALMKTWRYTYADLMTSED